MSFPTLPPSSSDDEGTAAPSPNPDGSGATPPPPPPGPYAASEATPPPPPAAAPYGSYAATPPGVSPPGNNTKAVIGLVLSILGVVMAFCCSLIGVPLGIGGAVLGYLAKGEIAQSGNNQSAGLAQGAFVTGIVAVVLSLAMFVLGWVLNIGLNASQWGNL